MPLISANGPCPLPLHPPPIKSAVSQGVIAGRVRLPPDAGYFPETSLQHTALCDGPALRMDLGGRADRAA